MALRDWLNSGTGTGGKLPCYVPIGEESPTISNGLATISKPLAKLANHQVIDFKAINPQISRISRISISNDSEVKKQGLKRLKVAVRGLPVNLDEMADYFKEDMADFASGAFTIATMHKAVEQVCYCEGGGAVYGNKESPAISRPVQSVLSAALRQEGHSELLTEAIIHFAPFFGRIESGRVSSTALRVMIRRWAANSR